LNFGARLLTGAQNRKPLPFKLGIITDEITQDLEEAARFIASYSWPYCELRTLWGKNIMNLTQEELLRAKSLIDKYQLKVSDIASPLFKYNLPEMPARPDEKRDTFLAEFTEQDTEDLLERAFKLARFFGTDKVRIFSYWRVEEPEKAYPHVRERLGKAARLAAENRIVLILENEAACNIGTGKELGRILRDVNSPSLRGVWDPGNAITLGEVPYPDGYREVRGLFPHMHIKDALQDPQTRQWRYTAIGTGVIDYRGQFRALIADGYSGVVSLETHYCRADGNQLESTRDALKGLLAILKELA